MRVVMLLMVMLMGFGLARCSRGPEAAALLERVARQFETDVAAGVPVRLSGHRFVGGEMERVERELTGEEVGRLKALLRTGKAVVPEPDPEYVPVTAFPEKAVYITCGMTSVSFEWWGETERASDGCVVSSPSAMVEKFYLSSKSGGALVDWKVGAAEPELLLGE